MYFTDVYLAPARNEILIRIVGHLKHGSALYNPGEKKSIKSDTIMRPTVTKSLGKWYNIRVSVRSDEQVVLQHGLQRSEKASGEVAN